MRDNMNKLVVTDSSTEQIRVVWDEYEERFELIYTDKLLPVPLNKYMVLNPLEMAKIMMFATESEAVIRELQPLINSKL